MENPHNGLSALLDLKGNWFCLGGTDLANKMLRWRHLMGLNYLNFILGLDEKTRCGATHCSAS